MHRRAFLAALALGAALPGAVPLAQTVVLTSDRDNTLIEQPQGIVSNGAGPVMVAGRVRATGGFTIRRALMHFDVAGGVPAGATIQSVKLTLTCEMAATPPDPRDLTLHLVTASWGEGTSFSTGGPGAFSTLNDATWLHRFFNDTLWTTPGGDFVAAASATTSVGDIGVYDWSSAQMVAEVQGWLDAPATNNGWVMLGDETVVQSTKLFLTHEAPDASKRPKLEIQYSTCSSAAASSRNGGSNPLSYTATPPVLGGTFVATVNNNLAGEVASRLFAFEAPLSLTLAGGQTLLCIDTGSGELLTGAGVAPTSSAGGVDTYSLPVPDVPATCGVAIYSQAIQFGTPPFTLSNAQDLTLGN